MHNIMRFIRQNKKQIIRIAVIAAFLFLILQILNYLTENNIPLCSNNEEPTLNNAARFLNLPKNQTIKLMLEGKLKED